MTMRAFHRILAIFVFALLLWIGVTGSAMQVLDLGATLSNAPETDPTMQSLNEGKFGDFIDYETAVLADFTAAPLPTTLNYDQALQTVLAAARKQQPQAAPNFVELRMEGTRPIGQLRFGTDVRAFDATTGLAAPIVRTDPLFPPYSLRQQLKKLHRFWFTPPEAPGVYFELLSGIILWVMIVTGLVTYFRLLKQRRKLGMPRLFWSAGGIWRTLHRGLSLASAIFLISIAASGTLLGFESVWHSLAPRSPHVTPANLTEAEVLPMLNATVAAMARTEPGVRIKAIRLRLYGGFKQGVVVTDEKVTRQIVFDTTTGKSLDLNTPGYPEAGFPFGREGHEWVKHFHSGYLFGTSGRVMNLFAGLSLVFLSVSGLAMYWQMWRKRRAGGRNAILWR